MTTQIKRDATSRAQVKMMILQVAAKPVTRLAIMNAAFLTHNHATLHIEELLAEGLLTSERNGLLYRTTNEGQKWLDTVR